MPKGNSALHFHYYRPLDMTPGLEHELSVPRHKVLAWAAPSKIRNLVLPYEVEYDPMYKLKASIASHEMLEPDARVEAASEETLGRVRAEIMDLIQASDDTITIENPTIGTWQNNFGGVDVGVPLYGNDKLIQEHLAVAGLFKNVQMSGPAVHTPHIRLARLRGRPESILEYDDIDSHMPTQIQLLPGILDIGIVTSMNFTNSRS